MGYRANVITQERQYGSSIFSDWEQFDEYFNYLSYTYKDDYPYANEERTYFEIDKGIVLSEIGRLQDMEGDFEFQSGMTTLNPSKYTPDTNRDIAQAWKQALEEAPKDSQYVALEWY